MEYLFVYGSLMADTNSPMARFLNKENRLITEISLPGKLYDLGRYPGFVYDENASGKVNGHLFEIANAPRVFGILDKFEGINESEPERSEYRRITVPYRLENRPVQIWFYQYNLSVRSLKEIVGGNYRTYWPHQPAHRRFMEGR